VRLLSRTTSSNIGAGKSRVPKKRSIGVDVWTAALDRVEQAYDVYEHVAVAFSGGKDSTATLHVALDVAERRGRLPLDVVHFDKECVSPDTIEYVERVAARDDISLRWMCLPQKSRNACSRREPYWYPWAPEVRHLWVRALPDGAITTLPGYKRQSLSASAPFAFPDRSKSAALLMGIRAAESMARYNSVTKHRGTAGADRHVGFMEHVALVKPIYDWSTADVWVAPYKNGWDYNRQYDRMADMGFNPHFQRVSPPFGDQAMQDLWMYQVAWPDLWDRMSRRVPGAATAARYARTPLYSHGKFELPDGIDDWRAAVAFYLQRYEGARRKGIEASIRGHIKWHYDLCGDPIPEAEKHPATGISWRELAIIAHRGDAKNRRGVKMRDYKKLGQA